MAAVAAVRPAVVHAHFKMLEPAGWQVEDDRGDPQKAAPCGLDAKSQKSNVVGKATGGSKFHLKVTETIFHPGHYRVSLAVNSVAELPSDPVTVERTTERGPMSVWATIQSPPQIPVIADGLFQHYTRPAAPAQGQAAPPLMWETDVQLPNITCPKCTIQVLEFMANHPYNQPGGYSYHHCAEIAITADPSKPLDKGWPSPATTN
ncbi:MAG TPA: SCE4755 family polysaccharide monooxygenase-like protein [Vicinamibacterales bacterium]|nr:SCE4755 family polysaccharide monooxygenase-like protein [Vicinamibacterales bacterium]